MSDTAAATDVAFLALGTNMGHRGEALRRLRDALAQRVVIEAASSEVLTRPAGVRNQPDFHNQVLRVRSASPLTPHAWLSLCHEVEAEAGRRPTYHWGPRIADCDILLLGEHGELSVELPELIVPHRELRNRPFLGPLLHEVGSPI